MEDTTIQKVCKYIYLIKTKLYKILGPLTDMQTFNKEAIQKHWDAQISSAFFTKTWHNGTCYCGMF